MEERKKEGGREAERRKKRWKEERRKGGRSKGGDEKRNLYSTSQALPSSSPCFCVPLERGFIIPSIKRVFSWAWWPTAATQHLGGCTKRILSSRPVGTTQWNSIQKQAKRWSLFLLWILVNRMLENVTQRLDSLVIDSCIFPAVSDWYIKRWN